MAEELEEGLEEKQIAGINPTPLVDVALTLVLIFMVTMPLSLIHSVNVRNQLLNKYGLTTPQENVVVYLQAEGIFVRSARGKKVPVPREEFGALLGRMIQLSSGKHVLIRPERDVPHGRTVWVMDLAKQNGARDLALLEASRGHS